MENIEECDHLLFNPISPQIDIEEFRGYIVVIFPGYYTSYFLIGEGVPILPDFVTREKSNHNRAAFQGKFYFTCI